MLPTSILRIWLGGLIALAVVSLGGYWLYDWYYNTRDREELYWALGLLAFALSGRWITRIGLLGFGANDAPTLPQPQEFDVQGYGDAKLHVAIYPSSASMDRPATRPLYLLTHGWSLNHSIWQYVIGDLLPSGDVAAWDLRGLGRSSVPKDRDFSVGALAEDLAAVLRHFEGRPIILVGHSIGGMTCQTLVRRHPQLVKHRVREIVLISTSPKNPVRAARFAPLWTVLEKPVLVPLLYLSIWLSPVVRLMNLLSYWNGSVHRTTRFSSFSGRQSWRQLDLACRLSSFASPAVVSRGMLAMLKFDEQQTLERFPTSATVIAGNNDRLTTIETNQEIAVRIPCRLAALTPGGHLAILERHDAVADELRRTLGDLRSSEKIA